MIYTVHYTHNSGFVMYHNVDNKLDLRALLDVLLDGGYTEINIQTHDEPQEEA